MVDTHRVQGKGDYCSANQWSMTGSDWLGLELNLFASYKVTLYLFLAYQSDPKYKSPTQNKLQDEKGT